MRTRHRRLLSACLGAVLLGACTGGPDTESTGSTPPTAAESGGATTSTSPATTSTSTSTSSTTLPSTTVVASSTTVAAEALPPGLDSLYPHLGNAGYDVEHYTIDLSLDADAGTIGALVTIEAVATADLDLIPLDFAGFDIAEVTVDGSPAPFSRSGNKLLVSPTATAPMGEAFSVSVEYSGTPGPVTSEAIGFPVGWNTAVTGEHYVVAEPDGAHTWFPGNDHPSDKASFTFRITVPDGLVAVANGTHVETVTDVGAATWVYDMPQPMATYLATVVIGEFQIVDDPEATDDAGVPIRNVLSPTVAATPPAALVRQGEMVAFFAEQFGPYPFDLYGIAVVNGLPAALENQTLSIFGDGLVSFPGFEDVLAHELAHQWFGDHLTPGDWSDIWLNEGFATYAEWLWLEHNFGPAAIDAVAQQTRDFFATVTTPPPGSPPADDLFNGSVYQRGALVLHALRLEIGDEAFFETLRTYVTRFAAANVRTADFIAVAEEVSGTDLDALFEAWLYGAEVPEL